MFIKKIDGPRSVELPDGTHMTRADLPPVNTRRWVVSRKAAVLKAIAAGLISAEDAIQLYSLSEEELESWQRAVARHGVQGLKTTKLQKYRQP